MSLSFDRAADYYDETRSLPDDLMAILVARLVNALPRYGLCLEIGVGTGRVALPLTYSGVRIVGVDISAAMLRRLVDKAGSAAPPIVLADATQLPFRDGTFASAIAAHVFHLIPRWAAAVNELFRVVRPGGVVLVSRAAGNRAPWQHAIRRHFYVEAGDPPWPPGIDTIEELDDEMRALGAEVRDIEDVNSEYYSTISKLLAGFEKGIESACWSIDDDTRRRAAANTREWAEHEFGDLDAPRLTSYASDWRAYRLP